MNYQQTANTDSIKVENVIAEVYKAIAVKAINGGRSIRHCMVTGFSEAVISLIDAHILPSPHINNAVYAQAIVYGIHFDHEDFWIERIVATAQVNDEKKWIPSGVRKL